MLCKCAPTQSRCIAAATPRHPVEKVWGPWGLTVRHYMLVPHGRRSPAVPHGRAGPVADGRQTLQHSRATLIAPACRAARAAPENRWTGRALRAARAALGLHRPAVPLCVRPAESNPQRPVWPVMRPAEAGGVSLARPEPCLHRCLQCPESDVIGSIIPDLVLLAGGSANDPHFPPP